MQAPSRATVLVTDQHDMSEADERSRHGRPRAQSEAVSRLPSGRWRIVGAWSSLRRSLPRREESEPNKAAPKEHSRCDNRRAGAACDADNRRRDSTADAPRKRVSLFLRRRRGEGVLRRAQSGLVAPVVGDGGEGRRYNQYAQEVEGIELVERRAGIRLDEEEADEIIGEICLEDFADGDDDFDLESVDFEPGSVSRMSRRPSLKIDGGVTFIADEDEMAQLFAEIGLEDWFDVQADEQWGEFEVDEAVVEEWRLAGEEHNRRYGKLDAAKQLDIRELALEFEQTRRRTRAGVRIGT